MHEVVVQGCLWLNLDCGDCWYSEPPTVQAHNSPRKWCSIKRRREEVVFKSASKVNAHINGSWWR